MYFSVNMLTRILAGSLSFVTMFCFVQAGGTPVLLWGANRPPKPTLMMINQREFSDLMKPLLRNYAIVAFVEPNLTTKDFLCRNPSTGESCYSFMKDARPRTYYASVEEPVEALKKISKSIKIINSDEIYDVSKLCAFAGKVSLIHFNTFRNQSVLERSMILESHDKTVAALSRELKCPIVYLYLSNSQFGITDKRDQRYARGVMEHLVTKPPPQKPKEKEYPITNTAAEGGYFFNDPLFYLFFKSLEYKGEDLSNVVDPNDKKPVRPPKPETTKKPEETSETPETPETTEPSETAETPETPEETPETPEETTETAETPEETTETAETPETPETPETTETPVTPETPATTETPETTVTPETPETTTEEPDETKKRSGLKKKKFRRSIQNEKSSMVDPLVSVESLSKMNSKLPLKHLIHKRALRSKISPPSAKAASTAGGKTNYTINPVKMSVEKFVNETFEDDVHSINILLEVKLTTDTGSSVTIKINQANNFFELKSVHYKQRVFRRLEEISTVSLMSYMCNSLVLQEANGGTLTFTNIQFQGFKTPNHQERIHFDEPWHCVGYITIGIAQGLFVSFIMLSIIFCGVLWLMDVKTMDRFEDPDAKEIVIHTDD